MIPPTTGNYNFFLSSDDNGEFWLSTDDNPGNLVLVCREPEWNGTRNWLGTERRNPTAPENRSTSIPLVAGNRYYFQASVKEAAGGDHVAVAWQQPGEPQPLNGSSPISGCVLESFVDPDVAALMTPVISKLSPASAQANSAGLTLTVDVECSWGEATVYWNGEPRSTTSLGCGSQLQALIPASDLVSAVDISTVTVTVVTAGGKVSNPLYFSIISDRIAGVTTVSVTPAQSGLAVFTPNISYNPPVITSDLDEFGETALGGNIYNPDGNAVIVTAAMFTGNPTATSLNNPAGGYLYLSVLDTDAQDAVAMSFYYSSAITGPPEEGMILVYFNTLNSQWEPVISSGPNAPVKEMADDPFGIPSGGIITAYFDATSTPTLADLNGVVFAFKSTPILRRLNPPSAEANSPGLTLIIEGGNFDSGSIVYWNGAARATTFVSSSELRATISAADLASGTPITTAVVTVRTADGTVSRQLLFTIISADLTAQSVFVEANQSGTIFTPNIVYDPPTITSQLNECGQAGIGANIYNSGEIPLTVTAANFADNPTAVAVVNPAGGYVYFNVSGADDQDSVAASFYYSSIIAGTPEDNLVLLYFNGITSQWEPVVSSGPSDPFKETGDDPFGIPAGGIITVNFDTTSTPKLTEMNGTVFTFGHAVAPTVPTIRSVSSLDGQTIAVWFDQLVPPHLAQNTANYLVNDGLATVNGATMDYGRGLVVLDVSGIATEPHTPFTVSASGIRNSCVQPAGGNGSANATIAPAIEFPHQFPASGLLSDGVYPQSGVVAGRDGMLYGTTLGGGNGGQGTLFRLNPENQSYGVVFPDFGIGSGAAARPSTPPLHAKDGWLYGVTGGGAYNFGAIYKIRPDGTGYDVIKSFSWSDGAYPVGALVQGTDGALYGTTVAGGTGGGPGPYYSGGTVFRLDPANNSYNVIYNFNGGPSDGAGPFGKLFQAGDGTFYGTTGWGGSVEGGVIFRLRWDGTQYRGAVVWDFGTIPGDGWGPNCGLVQASDGALYGTTTVGGDPRFRNIDGRGLGTIFKLQLDSETYTQVATLTGGEGAHPSADLVEGPDGALYGYTDSGGLYDGGSVFKLNHDGSGFRAVRDILTGYSDHQFGALVFGKDGALYGTMFLAQNIFRLVLPVPVISTLNPPSAEAGSPGFTLTVNGTRFESGATVLWNNTPRVTTFVSSSQLLATIPASDLASSADIATATVTVLNPSGYKSRPALFTITSAAVGESQSGVAPGNQNVIVTTPNISTPLESGEAAVAALIINSGSTEPIAATAATFEDNPTTSTLIDVGGGYVDLKVTGADASDSSVAYFYYPTSVVSAAEADVVLQYHTGQDWHVVLSSGGIAPIKDTTDDVDGTDSGGRFIVTFDNTSTPKLTELSGTVFAVAIPDTTAPVLQCPANIVAGTEPGQCSAAVSYAATATDDSGGATVSCNPVSGTRFVKGVTPVHCTATDGSGNQASCSFTVTVNDGENPLISCPANVTLGCSLSPSVPVSFQATASDKCDPNPTVNCAPPSGSGFPIGTTTVTCTATDASGNQSSCSFTVTRAVLAFTGFLAPIGGADGNGGSFASPVRTFKAKSTIPVKFTAACGGSPVLAGVHTLQAIKYSNETTAGTPIDATPTDNATTGNQFRLTGWDWHFNLDTKATGMSAGIWLLRATLADGSQHSVWIQIK